MPPASTRTDPLFPEIVLDEPGEAGVAGPFAQVALEQAVDKTLTYTVPSRLARLIRPGQRVRVPLGRKDRSQPGYVVAVAEDFDAAAAGVAAHKLKPVKEIADERVLVDRPLMELARWMGRYYCCALGLVLESMIPGAVKKRIGLGYTPVVRLAVGREEVQRLLEETKARKRRSLLARLLQVAPGETIDLVRLAGEAGVTPPTVRKLAKLGIVSVESVADYGVIGGKRDEETERRRDEVGDRGEGGGGVDWVDVHADALSRERKRAPGRAPHDLNDDQRRAFEEIAPRVRDGVFSTHLLHGVTGSGKTEVYLRLIAEAVRLGRQAVMLVPEIALTPQTVRRFTERFERVAVLHSGLSAGMRHRYWQQIAGGGADVVVGARSAVFAPVPRLGLIVVDEEHEGSYKQDTAPRYHARDVAIKRAQLAGVPVVLGSATPSLETYARCGGVQETKRRGDEETKGRLGGRHKGTKARRHEEAAIHAIHRLPRRVHDRPMPAVELVDMKEVARQRKGVHLLSPRLEKLLGHTVEQGHQAILLLNRRGYANFVYNPSTDEPVTCKYCDATMTYHRTAGSGPVGAAFRNALHTGQLHCHYCLAVDPLDEAAKRLGGNLSLFGLGTQRVEEEIVRKFPAMRFERVDSDNMRSARDYEQVLARFGRGEIDVLLGTQMIAKGLDFPNVALVGVVSGDTALSLPDFRAAERTFQLITQVSGRAGRGDIPGRVVLQTFNPYDPTIRSALSHDYEGFARRELEQRRELGLPPFGRMVRIILRDQEEQKLIGRAERLSGALLTEAGANVQVRGPMPCPISRIAGYFRQQIVLTSATPQPLQRLLAVIREAGHLAQGDRVAVDVDPVSLL